MIIKYVTIKRFSEISGYTISAIQTKIARGVWRENEHFLKAPDGRIMVNIKAIEKWVESTPEL